MDQDIIDWLNGGTAWGLPEVPMPDEARVKAQCFMLREQFFNTKGYLYNWKERAISRRKEIDFLLAFIEVNLGKDARDRAKQLAMAPVRPCHWLDDFGICCNPLQAVPFSSKCPPVQATCWGYAKDGRDAASRTLVSWMAREKER